MRERFLITSLGSIGQRHLANLRALRPEASIAVWRSGTSTDTALPAGVDAVFHSLADAVAFAPRAAVIASPATQHLAMVQAFSAAGIPVLVEKPFADTAEGLGALVDDLERTGAQVAVGYNLRLLPSLQQVRELLQQDAIGTVLGVRAEVGQYLPDWRPGQPYTQGVSAQRRLGGGALLELSHELDYLLWLFGLPQAVSARGGRLGALAIDVEDMVELSRFIGTEGTLVWRALDDSLDLYRAATGQWETQHFPRPDRNAVYVQELREFLAAIDGQPTVLTTPREGLNVLRVVDAARLSMAQGRRVEISPAH
jgi:predicted dehydrogenase